MAVLAGCYFQERIAPSDIHGSWQLLTIDGQPVGNTKIKTHGIEIAYNNTWRHSTEISGAFSGFLLNGDGTWSLKGNELQYTTGSNTGTSTLTLEGKLLKFSPDPAVLSNVGKPAITTYARQP